MIDSRRLFQFTAIAFALLTATVADAGVEFVSTHHSLGKVKTAGDVFQKFAFKVTGRNPVEFVELRPSCGCVVPRMTKRVYQPGETGFVEVGIHSASQTPGPHRYQVSMTVLEPRERKIVLKLDMDLYREITIEPSNLRMILTGESGLTQKISVIDPRPKKLTITDAVCSSRNLTVDIVGANPAHPSEQVVLLTVDGDFPEGETAAQVLLRTDDEQYPELVIPVTVVRPSQIQIIPDSIRLSATTAEAVRRVIVLRDRKGRPIEITEIKAGPGIECEPKKSNGFTRLDVEVDPNQIGQQSSIVLSVSEPIEATFTIPVSH